MGDPRARVTRFGTYKPTKSVEWKGFALIQVQREMGHLVDVVECGVGNVPVNVSPFPLTEAVFLHVVAVLARPQRLRRKKDPHERMLAAQDGKGSKPDEDNILKIVQDMLVLAGVMKDDTFVVDGRCTKWYQALDEQPHVFIDLRWGE